MFLFVSPSKNLNIKKFKFFTSFEFEKSYFKFKDIDFGSFAQNGIF